VSPDARADEIVIALAGQPNCGKSTLFNAVAGFKVDVGNFAGTTVSFAETRVTFHGRKIRLIDLPGTYSISSHDLAEKVARDFLLSGEVDALINVVDASMLSRSLEFTLQLTEMRLPMVVCLNMMDEAQRKGMEIDAARLEELLGAPVRTAVAVVGTGIEEVFRQAIQAASGAGGSVQPRYDRDIEDALARLLADYPKPLRDALPLSERFVLLRLLEMDEDFEKKVSKVSPEFQLRAAEERRKLAEHEGRAESLALGSHRHSLVLDLYEKVVRHRRGHVLGARERVDRFIIHPLGGAFTVVGSLLITFFLAFFLGNAIAGLVDVPFSTLRTSIQALPKGVGPAVLIGLFEGVVAGAGIVLPYLVPLLVLLAIFEDTGLLPRIAFMVDGILHRVGLHGSSVVPLILGFGCNVPSIMATRTLENPRDRFVTMMVAPFVTCSARSVVIIALAGKYLGVLATVALYLFGGLMSAAVSYALTRSKRRRSLGVIMEVPPLRKPYPRIVARKVWMRLREFVLIAWPVLIVSSLALSLMSYAGMDATVNGLLAPLTSSVLHLPVAVGIPLFLGLFRKELTLIMLGAALGTEAIGTVLSTGQILVLVVFTMLYVPCVATLAAQWREGGWRTAVASALLNLGVSIGVAGGVARLIPAV
jgi:ferrous iron transport protein B